MRPVCCNALGRRTQTPSRRGSDNNWNAESGLASALGAHYAQAEDKAHGLLAEAFYASADLEVNCDKLHVRLEALLAPRRSRAIASLCAELTATETLYPGTELRLDYSVKGC
ncbi:MAG: putative transposase [Acidimicrobiales bacterium]